MRFLVLLFAAGLVHGLRYCNHISKQQGLRLSTARPSTTIKPQTSREGALAQLKVFLAGVSVSVGATVALPKVGYARESKLDFDQRTVEVRPSQSDSAAPPQTGVLPDFNSVRRDIRSLIEARADKGPTLVRLAWHSSGTFDKMSKMGGSGLGTIRFREELSHGANAGLDNAVAWLEPIYKKYNNLGKDLSYGDLYTLAGVVAIEALGGPKIGWRAGRKDSFDVSDVTPDGLLPDADKGDPSKTASALRKTFGRMGFDDQEIVALSGAHAIGRCHATASGYVGPWTFTPQVFNNQYFVLLKNLKWAPDSKQSKFQYTDPSGKLMMLPSDIVLIQDSGFRAFVEKYAASNKIFFSDFAKAFQKLEELGTKDLFDV